MKNKLFLLFILTIFMQSTVAQRRDKRLSKFISNDKVSYVKFMFVGDIPVNRKIVEAAYRSKNHSYDFQPIFHYIRPYLNLGDIVVGNLETVVGTPPYGKYPQYATPKEIATSLKYAGFNLVMTANGKGINTTDETLETQSEILKKVRIKSTGTFKNKTDKANNNPLMIEKKGVKIAFLNYLQGIEANTGSTPITNHIDTAIMANDIKVAREKGAEFIIVYMNWGTGFEVKSNYSQQEIAKFLVFNGVDLVVGTHPHVVQEMDVHEFYEGETKTREGLVVYSLGDFLSTANSTKVNSSAIFEVVISKTKKTKKIKIEDYGYIPTYCYSYNFAGKKTWTIVPVRQVELDNIEIQFMSKYDRDKMMRAAENIRYKFSPFMQEVEYILTDEIINDVAESLTVTKRPMNESQNIELEKVNLLHKSYGFKRVLNTDKKEDPNKPIYKVQFMASRKEIKVDTRFYRHLKGYEVIFEKGYYKYLIGNVHDKAQVNNLCDEVRRLGHSKAFVVVYYNGKKGKVRD